MKETIETIELCNMIAERNYEATIEEAAKKIAQLEREKLSIERKFEARRASDIFLALGVGILLGIILFMIAAYTYKLGWWSAY